MTAIRPAGRQRRIRLRIDGGVVRGCAGGVPDTISLDIDDPVAVLTLRRPEVLNAFTHQMLAEVESAIAQAMTDRRVVGVVITGEGRGFCSGLDAQALAATTDGGSSGRPDDDNELVGLFSYLLEQPKPIIAAVNGVAAGGGFVLASKCDLRIASTDAAFTTIFTKRGLIAEHGMTWLLPRQVGVGAALDLLWSSRKIDAEEAFRIGLVQRVVEPDQLLDTACGYVRDLANEVSPWALEQTKRLVYRHVGMAAPDAFREADEVTWAALDRADASEGVAALVERRPPKFDRVGDEDR